MVLELECDPTNTGIEVKTVKPVMDTPVKPIWTIDGPRSVIEICWGLRKLAPLEDF